MSPQEQRVLKAAVSAFHRTTGLGARVLPAAARRGREIDAIVEIEANHRKQRFAADVKAVDRFAIPAAIKARLGSLRQPPLLVTAHATREIAAHCRDLHLPFIDTAGNAYLKGRGLFVYVAGQERAIKPGFERFRALNPAGLRITFALLCRPELIGASYRVIAAAAGVALGTVGPVLKDLEVRGLLRVRKDGERKLPDAARIVKEWVTHYPIALRPKLNPRRFQADAERLMAADLKRFGAYWGAEPAAAALTGFLKPERFTIYARDPIGKLVGAQRMRAEPNGNVEILEPFWNFAPDPEYPGVVPPLLAYADLLATHDGRNAEAAKMIYDQQIEPAFQRPG